MEWFIQPWPWHVSGFLIALVALILLFFGKSFGMSANLRTFWAAAGAGKKVKFFDFNWHKQNWNLYFMAGSALGGFLTTKWLSGGQIPDLNPKTIERLKGYGFESAGEAYIPTEFFGNQAFSQPGTLLLLLIAGFLVGFGARYAGGCASGHAVSGLSNLQLPSLIAVIGFFIGGLIMVHLIFPILF